MYRKILTWFHIGFHYIVYWVVGTDPESHHSIMAYHWMNLGRWRRCIRHCEKFLSYQADDQINAILGYCHASLNNWAESAAAYSSISNIYSSPSFALGLAEAELNIGNINRAREIVAVIDISHDHTTSEISAALKFLKDRITNGKEWEGAV